MSGLTLQRVVAFGTLACATACCAANVINFVRALPDQLAHHFVIAFWLLSLDIVLLTALLFIGSLVRSARFLHYFGFLQYTAGSGVLLTLIGSLVIGMAGQIGLIAGAASIGWGGLSCAIHCATKSRTPATNEPLLP